MDPLATSPAYPAGNMAYGRPDQSPTITLGDWIVTYLISCVPLVGFIMLFVWAFSSSTPPSKANWAKAALLVVAIFSVLGFLFASTIMALFMQTNPRFH